MVSVTEKRFHVLNPRRVNNCTRAAYSLTESIPFSKTNQGSTHISESYCVCSEVMHYTNFHLHLKESSAQQLKVVLDLAQSSTLPCFLQLPHQDNELNTTAVWTIS